MSCFYLNERDDSLGKRVFERRGGGGDSISFRVAAIEQTRIHRLSLSCSILDNGHARDWIGSVSNTCQVQVMTSC